MLRSQEQSSCHISHALQSLLKDFYEIIKVNLYSRTDIDETETNNNYRFVINDCRACNLWQRKLPVYFNLYTHYIYILQNWCVLFFLMCTRYISRSEMACVPAHKSCVHTQYTSLSLSLVLINVCSQRNPENFISSQAGVFTSPPPSLG